MTRLPVRRYRSHGLDDVSMNEKPPATFYIIFVASFIRAFSLLFSVRYIFAPRFTRSRVSRLEFSGNLIELKRLVKQKNTTVPYAWW